MTMEEVLGRSQGLLRGLIWYTWYRGHLESSLEQSFDIRTKLWVGLLMKSSASTTALAVLAFGETWGGRCKQSKQRHGPSGTSSLPPERWIESELTASSIPGVSAPVCGRRCTFIMVSCAGYQFHLACY